jgi:hypothetical protein
MDAPYVIQLDGSDDAPALAALAAEWNALRDGAPAPAAVEPLARRVAAHRGRLFLANATLQVDAPPGSAPAARLEANQTAIKRCTVMLGEMGVVLGPEIGRAHV